ncbi:uncharacterized protein G2W53_037028 [Senna tora]|uniref:Uncharacterized protein n=1 Tax=Senna tora TaxID=362788 RepID=A0A834SWW2_9FABA|nr:uncharacterized protein G2W53_037028 [Senna tora]
MALIGGSNIEREPPMSNKVRR